MPEVNSIKTGITGLDSILLGGPPRTNVILVQGVTGSGKTLMGVEFIYRGIVEFGEPGLIVVFETPPDKLIRDALALGCDLDKLQQQKKLQIIFTSPEVFGKELLSPDSLLLETASEMGAQRIFVDGIGLLVSGRGMRNSIRTKYRELLQRLIEWLNRENLTAMLPLEVGTAPDSIATKETADFLVDTVAELGRQRLGRRLHLSLEVLNGRGQDYDLGEHTLYATGGKGLEVFRRVQAAFENPEFLGISSYMPDFSLSSIVDTVVEIDNSLRRCIPVVKSRGSPHSFDTREFVIGQGEIALVPLEPDLLPVLPLQRYSSLLSRAPTRFSRPAPRNDAAALQDLE